MPATGDGLNLQYPLPVKSTNIATWNLTHTEPQKGRAECVLPKPETCPLFPPLPLALSISWSCKYSHSCNGDREISYKNLPVCNDTFYSANPVVMMKKLHLSCTNCHPFYCILLSYPSTRLNIRRKAPTGSSSHQISPIMFKHLNTHKIFKCSSIYSVSIQRFNCLSAFLFMCYLVCCCKASLDHGILSVCMCM